MHVDRASGRLRRHCRSDRRPPGITIRWRFCLFAPLGERLPEIAEGLKLSKVSWAVGACAARITVLSVDRGGLRERLYHIGQAHCSVVRSLLIDTAIANLCASFPACTQVV